MSDLGQRVNLSPGQVFCFVTKLEGGGRTCCLSPGAVLLQDMMQTAGLCGCVPKEKRLGSRV